MPRTQNLDHKHTHTKRERPRFTRFGKMPTFSGQKREIYWWFIQDIRGLQLVLSRTLTRNQPHSKMDSHPLFIRRRRKPQNSSRSGPESILTGLSSTARSTAQCPLSLQDLLEILVDWPNWIPLPHATSVDHTKWSTDPNLVHIGRTLSRPTSCYGV